MTITFIALRFPLLRQQLNYFQTICNGALKTNLKCLLRGNVEYVEKKKKKKKKRDESKLYFEGKKKRSSSGQIGL